MSNINIFDPMILELEELSKNHPDPNVRAEAMHLIDLMTGVDDQNMLELMHQFYHLREQLREQREIERLQEASASNIVPFDFTSHFEAVDTPPKLQPDAFQEVMDEIEVDELVLAHKRWHVTIGEA